jgi:hypothetical protein
MLGERKWTLRIHAVGFYSIALSLFAATATGVAPAQKAARTPDTVDYQRAGAPLPSAPVDKEVAAALKQVSTEKIKANITRLVEFNNRSTISSTETDLKPGTGVLAAADWIKEQYESYSKACGGCLQVQFDEFTQQPEAGFNNSRPRIVKPTLLRNVYAVLKGTDPTASKRIYLVTGHYDTRETDVMNTHDFAPGANDDSSGTAVSLEAARILSQMKFPATIIFVAVAGEEQGLNGSRHLAQLAKKQGWQLEGVLNNDIVGGDTTPGDTLQSKSRVRVFSQGILPSAPLEQIRAALNIGADSETPSRQLARQVLEVDRTYFKGPKPLSAVMELRLDRFLRGGDHRSFSDEGFPSVRFTEWRENYDHQHQHVRTENGKEYGDLLKFDDFEYIAQVARLNMATLATLAKSPGVPQGFTVMTSNLDNDTLLKWDAPLAADADVWYQIVWRETTVNDWQYAVDAARYPGPSPRSVRLPISKDNVFFGLRACTPAMVCSQAVAPVVGR